MRRRIQLCFLLIVVLASGISEMVTLGALLPFLGALSNPGQLVDSPIVEFLSQLLGLKDFDYVLPAASIAFAATAICATFLRLLNLWLDGRLVAAVGSDLSCEVYRRTLYQPYEFHIQQNTSKVITSVTTQINFTIVSLKSFLRLVASCVLSLSIVSALLVIDIKATLISVFLFSAAYGLLVVSARRKLKENSSKITDASRRQIKALQEGLGAIRDVILDNSQPEFLEVYKENDYPQRRLQARNGFIINSPRYVLEALFIVLIAIWGGFLVHSGVSIIPLLGAMALGAQRLLPSMQQIYIGWSTLNANNSAISDVLGMLDMPLPGKMSNFDSFIMQENICFENVSFAYGQHQKPVLNDLNLVIGRGETVGLIGSTGSGKSTTVDLLMGLLSPSSGKVLVDGIDINNPNNCDFLRSWRSSIAHVPQSIYLSDCTIAENIAFGVPACQLEFDRIILAAQRAKISEFIESCPNKYNTYVGERGVSLSGGQRQRIGIARALYKRARILVLDEATSALDPETESAVISSLSEVGGSMTVIMIAHRLSTMYHCDRVIKMCKGVLTADGPPSQILSSLV